MPAAHVPHLADCEHGFALSPIPIWVVDINSHRIPWANPAGLEFWQASSVEELAARDLGNKVPEAVRVRVQRAIERVERHEAFQEDWTFFPKGKATPVVLHMRPIMLGNGRLGMLNQAMPIEEKTSASVVRTMAMLRHAKATIVFVDAAGAILTQNAVSAHEFKGTNSWLAWLVDRDEALEILGAALSGKTVEMETRVHSEQGERVHAIIAHELRDPVNGERGVLIQHFDVTERVEAEKLVQKHLATLHEQQREILALSTPMLDVGARTLALPLIGRIDEMRANEITSRLLEMVANRGIERVILDITGVMSVDSMSITFVRRLVDAIVLLGAKPIVTGIRSDLARMLAASEENLSGITIQRSLADGLAHGRGRI